jgi:hypothetical protein
MGDKVWTEKDYEVMGWHDARIYSLSPPDDTCAMIFLIDYILRWEEKHDASGWYYWVSPCVLKFSDVFDLRIDLDFGNTTGLRILDIKHVGNTPWPNGKGESLLLSIECDHGTISFSCDGFEQTALKPAVRSTTQDFGIWTGG